MAVTEAVECLGSDLEKGLIAEAVAKRYETYGWNELPLTPGKPAWIKFLLQFHQPLLYILLLAGAVKAFLGSWTNAGVIWGVTVLNAIIGYVQEASPVKVISTQLNNL
ncbi:MAG: cation-transporting P-type ATPase, partial [Phormidesmis sp.]